MKKNGFTLTELLAVIVILGVLAGIAIPSVIFISNKIKNDMFCSKVEVIEKAAELYGQDNERSLTNNCIIDGSSYGCIEITVNELVEQDYISSDEEDASIDPRDNTDMGNDVVQIYKKYNRIYAQFKFSDEDKETCE